MAYFKTHTLAEPTNTNTPFQRSLVAQKHPATAQRRAFSLKSSIQAASRSPRPAADAHHVHVVLGSAFGALDDGASVRRLRR